MSDSDSDSMKRKSGSNKSKATKSKPDPKKRVEIEEINDSKSNGKSDEKEVDPNALLNATKSFVKKPEKEKVKTMFKYKDEEKLIVATKNIKGALDRLLPGGKITTMESAVTMFVLYKKLENMVNTNDDKITAIEVATAYNEINKILNTFNTLNLEESAALKDALNCMMENIKMNLPPEVMGSK